MIPAAISIAERTALATLPLDWIIMPPSFVPTSVMVRLELLGLIECRMLTGGGYAVRATVAGYQASGRYLQ